MIIERNELQFLEEEAYSPFRQCRPLRHACHLLGLGFAIWQHVMESYPWFPSRYGKIFISQLGSLGSVVLTPEEVTWSKRSSPSCNGASFSSSWSKNVNCVANGFNTTSLNGIRRQSINLDIQNLLTYVYQPFKPTLNSALLFNIPTNYCYTQKVMTNLICQSPILHQALC